MGDGRLFTIEQPIGIFGRWKKTFTGFFHDLKPDQNVIVYDLVGYHDNKFRHNLLIRPLQDGVFEIVHTEGVELIFGSDRNFRSRHGQ